MRKLIFLLPLFSFCFANADQKTSNVDTLPKIVIINAFDASSLQVRKNKKELFKELADSMKLYLKKNIKTQLGLEAIVNAGLVTQITDSIIHSIMVENRVGKAIVIRSLEVYFNEGEEKHTEEYGLSPKIETSYDLCSKVDYAFYTMDSASKQSQINHCDYFTTRSVNDTRFVIKFGPDIVGKKKHTYGAVQKNAEAYISLISSLLLSDIIK